MIVTQPRGMPIDIDDTILAFGPRLTVLVQLAQDMEALLDTSKTITTGTTCTRSFGISPPGASQQRMTG